MEKEIEEKAPQSPSKELAPKELAEETLQTLLKFTEHLENLSKRSSELIAQTDAAAQAEIPQDLLRLVDGISAFTEAVSTVKQVLHVGSVPPINILEVDLLSILKDMLQCHETKQMDYMTDLLREHLPKNLSEWRTDGIPFLIRLRDN